MEQTHIDSGWHNDGSDSETNMLFEIESAVEEFLLQRFGYVSSFDELMTKDHTKIRVQISIQRMCQDEY